MAPQLWAPMHVAREPAIARLGELGLAVVPPKSTASQGMLLSWCLGGCLGGCLSGCPVPAPLGEQLEEELVSLGWL